MEGEMDDDDFPPIPDAALCTSVSAVSGSDIDFRNLCVERGSNLLRLDDTERRILSISEGGVVELLPEYSIILFWFAFEFELTLIASLNFRSRFDIVPSVLFDMLYLLRTLCSLTDG